MNHSTQHELFNYDHYYIFVFWIRKLPDSWRLQNTWDFLGSLVSCSKPRRLDIFLNFQHFRFQKSNVICLICVKQCLQQGGGQYTIIKHINIATAIKTFTLSVINKEDYKQLHRISGQDIGFKGNKERYLQTFSDFGIEDKRSQAFLFFKSWWVLGTGTQ